MEAIDEFKTVEDVLDFFGIYYKTLKYMFGGLPEICMYQYIAELTCKAFNDGWKPNFKDNNEPKWFLCFTYDSENIWIPSSAKFYGTSINNNLMFKHHKHCEYVRNNKEFLDIFKKAYGF